MTWLARLFNTINSINHSIGRTHSWRISNTSHVGRIIDSYYRSWSRYICQAGQIDRLMICMICMICMMCMMCMIRMICMICMIYLMLPGRNSIICIIYEGRFLGCMCRWSVSAGLAWGVRAWSISVSTFFVQNRRSLSIGKSSDRNGSGSLVFSEISKHTPPTVLTLGS